MATRNKPDSKAGILRDQALGDPDGLAGMARRYLDWMEVRNYSDQTVPDVTRTTGIRDRAILETLYSTGVRRMELMNLSLYDLDIQRGTLMIRQGKGKKDRVVPIGERAVKWGEKYLSEARPSLALLPDNGVLFLSRWGEAFTRNGLSRMVRDYVKRSECGKKGSCHIFRHTMATLMLENGDDLRVIQEILGHANLATTQIYTQVSIRRLKEVHNLTHPANLSKAQEVRRELEAELEDEMAEDDGSQ